MKVVYVGIDRGARLLTPGKVYDAEFSNEILSKHNPVREWYADYYYLSNDNGGKGLFNSKYFIPLKELRKQKLKLI